MEPSVITRKTEKPAEKKKYTAGNALCDFLDVIVPAVLLAIVIFTLFGRVAVVSGTSMTNTLDDGDGLIVSSFLYEPKQGDIVVCQTRTLGFREPIIKRVIATAGQTVKLDTATWSVYVDGVKLDEPYIKRIEGSSMNGWGYGEEYTVPEGYIFCMGDNRNGSWDCRDPQIGPIDERYVIGRAIFRYLPLGNAKGL